LEAGGEAAASGRVPRLLLPSRVPGRGEAEDIAQPFRFQGGRAVISKLIEFRTRPKTGENAVIEDYVVLGKNNAVGVGAVLHTGAMLSDNVRVDDYACICKPPLRAEVSSPQEQFSCYLGEGTVVGTGAVVYRGARLGTNCRIGDYACVGEDASLGNGAILGRGASLEARCVLGRGCTVGANAWLDEGVVLEDGCVVGARAVLPAGFVLRKGERIAPGEIAVCPPPASKEADSGEDASAGGCSPE